MTNLSKSQFQEIDAYLDIFREQEAKPRNICIPYELSCKQNGKEPVSSESIRLWLERERKPTQLNSFYEYVHSINDHIGDDPEQLLMRVVDHLFPSGHDNNLAKLKRLAGTYKIIRKLWTPANSEDCFECCVVISASGSKVTYTEYERFNSARPIDEIYTGYVFLFGSSVWIIAHEQHGSCIKFLTIHDFSPPILSQASSIDFCRGNLIAVSGNGPNFSHPFAMRRVRNEFRQGRKVLREEVKLDPDVYDYLYVNDEKEKIG